MPDDLALLPDMSPVDEPIISPRARSKRRTPGLTIPVKTLLVGIGLVVVCGLLLFFVYGTASMAVDPDDPRYWTVVSETMFGMGHAGSVARPAALGLLLGIPLICFAIYRGRSGKPPALGEH